MTSFANFFRFMLIMFISCPAFGQKIDWQSEWIGLPHAEGDTNIWTAFYKTYEIADVPQTAYAKIATDSKYWLWINGDLAVFEGQLKRGPNPHDTYYDEVNLSPYLKKGKNTIAVLTWYWGRDGFDHKNSGKSALLFEAMIGDNVLHSDATWKAIRHPAFRHTGPPLPNYRLPEFNICFDARDDLPDWRAGDVGGDAWQPVVSYGIPPVGPWNKLEKRPIPMWFDSGLVTYENEILLPKTSNGDTIVAKLPRNITITPYLKIDAPSGLKIDVRTDNYKGGSEYNVRTEYITRGGVQEFETFGYMNGHEVYYNIPAGVKIISLKYRETRYNAERVGQFICDDPFYNNLWNKSYNTLNVNLRDAIQDPDRERAQWWGDAVILMGEILYACDSNGILAIRKAIHNLVDWQKSDGVLYSPVPSGSWDKELPTQMLASIGKYGFWNYYRYTADTGMIRYVYPAVKKYLNLWHLGGDGLVIHRTGGWDWLDWGEDVDTALIDNAWYYMAIEAVAQMAELIGKQSDLEEYRNQMKSIKKNFNKRFWDGRSYRSPGNKGVVDDRGNGLAVVTGLADFTKFDAIKKVLQTEFHASPYMEKYIMEAFFMMKDAEGGLDRMKNRYSNMVQSPLTTLWEGWGIGSEGYGGGSYNHGWSGGPLTLLSQYVAGIAPERPAYETFKIMPQLGNLSAVHCVTPTLKGNIIIDLKKVENESLAMEVVIPDNSLATVGLPKLRQDWVNILVNDRLIFKDEKNISDFPSVQFIKEDNSYFVFRVKPGKWSFKLF